MTVKTSRHYAVIAIIENLQERKGGRKNDSKGIHRSAIRGDLVAD